MVEAMLRRVVSLSHPGVNVRTVILPGCIPNMKLINVWIPRVIPYGSAVLTFLINNCHHLSARRTLRMPRTVNVSSENNTGGER